MYGDGCISKQSFRTCSCDFKETVCSYDRVLDVPEMSCLFLMLNLCIGKRSLTYRTPVDDSGTFVDKSFFMETNEYFFDCI